MLDRIKRSFKILKLTRKYFRANQVTHDCQFYLNGLLRKVKGDHVLSMMLDIVIDDSYGLKRFNIKALDSIVDIGANVGIFSLHARTLFPDARLLAFEPSSKSRLFLEENIKGLNIDIYPYAVGNSRGKIVLNELDDMSACYISLEKDITALNSQECELINLDDVVAKLEMSDTNHLLKIDCEGSEYEIMQSPSLNSFTYIVGELHTCQYGNPKIGLKMLKDNGFRIDKWVSFPDGLAGVFWASNTNK